MTFSNKKWCPTLLDFLWLGREQWIIHQNPLLKIFLWVVGPLGIHTRIRNAHVLKIIEGLHLPTRACVLDAGCGQAYASFWLAHRHPEWDIWGVDIDGKIIERNRRIASAFRLANLHFQEEDVTSLNAPTAFDLIFSVDVLEHLKNDVEALLCWRQAIKPTGWLVLHLPLRHQLQKRVFPSFKKHLILDHARDEYVEEEIKVKLNQAKFTVCSISYGFGIWGELAFELNYLFWQKPSIRTFFALLTFPLAIFLGYIDCSVSWNQGNSLIVLSRPAT